MAAGKHINLKRDAILKCCVPQPAIRGLATIVLVLVYHGVKSACEFPFALLALSEEHSYKNSSRQALSLLESTEIRR